MPIPVGTVLTLSPGKGVDEFFGELSIGDLAYLRKGQSVWASMSDLRKIVSTNPIQREREWVTARRIGLKCVEFLGYTPCPQIFVVESHTSHGDILLYCKNAESRSGIYLPKNEEALPDVLPWFESIFTQGRWQRRPRGRN